MQRHLQDTKSPKWSNYEPGDRVEGRQRMLFAGLRIVCGMSGRSTIPIRYYVIRFQFDAICTTYKNNIELIICK